MRRSLLVLAIFAGLIFACRSQALAALHVCDRTPLPVSVALAIEAPSATGLTVQSQGWWQIDSGKCLTTIDNDLQAGVQYYLYAKSTLVTWAGDPKTNSKDVAFCSNRQDAFNYTDRPKNACTEANDEMVYFIHEPVGGPDWTINLDIPT
jgi:uncharacterized membrane protein